MLNRTLNALFTTVLHFVKGDDSMDKDKLLDIYKKLAKQVNRLRELANSKGLLEQQRNSVLNVKREIQKILSEIDEIKFL